MELGTAQSISRISSTSLIKIVNLRNIGKAAEIPESKSSTDISVLFKTQSSIINRDLGVEGSSIGAACVALLIT